MPPPEREDADDLVVRAALGEDLTADERRRLDTDPDLQAEVAELAEIVEVARDAPPDDATGQHLDRLWSGIASEAFADGDGRAHHEESAAPARTGWGVGLAVLAAAAVAAVAALVVVGPLSDAAPPPVAAAELDPVAGTDVVPVQGRFVRVDGDTLLRLDLSVLPPPQDGFYEVWLLDAERGRLASLGPARPDGVYALPSGVRVGDYPLVDVSVEPHDGDPGHSGTSILQGPVRDLA